MVVLPTDKRAIEHYGLIQSIIKWRSRNTPDKLCKYTEERLEFWLAYNSHDKHSLEEAAWELADVINEYCIMDGDWTTNYEILKMISFCGITQDEALELAILKIKLVNQAKVYGWR